MIFKGKAYPADVVIIISIYSIGFLGGTYNHVVSLLTQGFLARSVPLWLNLYWDSLTLWDPLAAMLVWIRPKYGIALSVLIMFTDVIINAYAYVVGFFGDTIPGMIPMGLFLQSLFATYIFVTAPVLIEKLRKCSLL